MLATTRLLVLSALLAVLLAPALAVRADAAPFRPRPYSESARLEAKDACRLGGGTSFETVYHYNFGSSVPTSATTTCHGGKNDGQTCEISGSSKSCSTVLRTADEPLGAPPSDVATEQIAASPSSSTPRRDGSVLDGALVDVADEESNW
jgi:hypothetical protein